MISRLSGAFLRAILMAALVSTPAFILPNLGSDTAQVVALMAMLAAAFTMVEYASDYPGLVEFRDAPPFNRIRFVALFVTLILLALMVKGETEATTLTRFITAIGAIIGNAIDFPFSPVKLLVLTLPDGTPAAEVERLRGAAGISYLISLISLAALLMALRLGNWPRRRGVFNVWVNLPTFDPTAGGDVVFHLERDANVNIVLGFVLPFLAPAVLKGAASLFWSVSMTNGHTMIWLVAAWAFLPASLFMRGIAMGRVAAMIREERNRAEAKAARDGVAAAQPA